MYILGEKKKLQRQKRIGSVGGQQNFSLMKQRQQRKARNDVCWHSTYRELTGFSSSPAQLKGQDKECDILRVSLLKRTYVRVKPQGLLHSFREWLLFREGTIQPYGILESKVRGSENLTGTLYRKSVLQRRTLASGFLLCDCVLC